MSHVTNIVFTATGFNDVNWSDNLIEVNRHIVEKQGCIWGFVDIHDEYIPKKWYVGTNFLEVNMAIGAFDVIDLDALKEKIRSLPWERPTGVQLIIRDQLDDRFSVWNVKD